MKTLTLFYLETCPYCIRAKRAIEELYAENTAYRDIELKRIEESREPDIAERYDYYYVPTIYDGNRKLYEASPSQDYASIKDSIRNAFDDAIG